MYGTLAAFSRPDSISGCPGTDDTGRCAAPPRELSPVLASPINPAVANRHAGQSRNTQLTQNVRTLPFRSSETGMM